jgi:copper ion binding protein
MSYELENSNMSTTVEQITLTSPDISCGHCVATVQEVVGSLAGVKTVAADATTKHVDVTFDPSQVSQAEIAAALDDAGYPAQQ